MDIADWLKEKAAAIGSTQQYEVHLCHYPDAGCSLCEAWEDLGQQRVPIATVLAIKHTAEQEVVLDPKK